MSQQLMRVDRRSQQRLRRILRSVEPETRREIPAAVEETAQRILANMQARTPVRTGALRNALTYRLRRQGSQARVGLVTKKKQRDFFYLRFFEQGTAGFPPRNIPPMAAQPILEPAFQDEREAGIQRINAAVITVLNRVAERGR